MSNATRETALRAALTGTGSVLIAGAYGSGKSSVAEEIAERIEADGLPYAAIDLDWLTWFEVPPAIDPGGRASDVFRRNLAAIVGNYRDVGVRYFVLAGWIDDHSALELLRAEVPSPLRVVGLEVPLEEIERRLRRHPTIGRAHDLRQARVQVRAGAGLALADLVIPNVGPIGGVAETIIDWLGWRGPALGRPDRSC